MSTNENNIPQEIIQSTEIAAAAAESVVESYQAMEVIKQQEDQAQQAKDKEELIAEAYKLTGRVEALKLMSDFGNVSSLLLLKNIKENKIYKNMQDIETWENYCKSIGYSYKTIDDKLEFLNTLGTEFLETVSTFGVGYRDLKKITSKVKAGELQIKDESIIIDGETIPLEEKDILKDALTDLVAKNKEEISKLKAENKAKEKMVQTYAEAKEKKEQELQQANIEKDALKDKLNSFYNGRLGKVAAADRDDFQDITNLELEANKLIASANLLLEKDYSNFNANMFCAVISKLMVAIDDARQKAALKYNYNFEGGILTNDELRTLDNGETPLDFLDAE